MTWATAATSGLSSRPRAPALHRVLRLQKTGAVTLHALTTTSRVAFGRARPSGVDDPERVRSYFSAAARLGEFVAYKVTIVLLLLALGSSNATIRQILDTLRQ